MPATRNSAKIDIDWIDAEQVTDETAESLLSGCDGILVPGGFGNRGIEGKIAAAKYARTCGVPYFGICLGMQTAVIEYARHVLGLCGANSSEFATDCPAVIDLMPDQQGNIPKGGTMRLGAYPCQLQPGTRLRDIYDEELIAERHRHRYEFNNAYRDSFAQSGMVFGGTSPDGRLIEAIELPGHPFYVAVQYHPEFKSRPNKAHPIFRAFIAASLENKDRKDS